MTLAAELESRLSAGTMLQFGQVQLSRTPGGIFEACHVEDKAQMDGLEVLNSPGELREMAKFDAAGQYRPLKTAPTLRKGWKTYSPDTIGFLARLDAIYPAVFATWVAYDRGDFSPVSLRKTLDRQTGMYRFAGTISDQMANRMMRELCSPGCIRRIAWPINDDSPVSRLKSQSHSIPVICTEACTFAISTARSLAKEAYDNANAPKLPCNSD